jgi:hypothetical protein
MVCTAAPESLWTGQAEELGSRLSGSELTGAWPGEDPVSDWLGRFV